MKAPQGPLGTLLIGLLIAGLGCLLATVGLWLDDTGLVLMGGVTFVAGWAVAAVGSVKAGFRFGRRR